MNCPNNIPNVLTPAEVAGALKITTHEVADLIASGQLRALKIGSATRIPQAFLEKYLANLIEAQYNGDSLGGFPSQAQITHLGNCIDPDMVPLSEGETEMATKAKINQPIIIHGEKRWITANTMQEFTNKIIQLVGAAQPSSKHLFEDYAWNWFNTYSQPNIETATATTYKRQLTCHILPAFADQMVEDITPDDVQRLFNGMTGAKATKDKARMVLNQIMDAAVEDGLLPQNPAKSRKVKVTGKASKSTAPYTVEQMRYLAQHIGEIKNPVDRLYLALQAFHPLRLEEVLGLHYEDVDADRTAIYVRRAVTHPTRNQPEVKDTKTDSSQRTIGLSSLALPHLLDGPKDGFIFGGSRPLSYIQVRHMCQRIKKDLAFSENITPIRFRTTVLTDLYDQTKDIKLAQNAAGHTTSAMTLKYYVKGRETSSAATAAVERAYSA